MLHVDNDVDVVQQHPAALALAFPADGLGPGLAQAVLDLIDHRVHLAVVGGRAEQERVGDDELVADVVGNDVGGELVRCGCGGDLNKLDGPVGGCHGCWRSSLEVPRLLRSHDWSITSISVLLRLSPAPWSRGQPKLRGRACRKRADLVIWRARGAGQAWYSRRLLMYCTMPSGTRYQMGSPARTRSRHSVDEMARAGTSMRLIRSSGRPVRDSRWPGRGQPTKCASLNSSSASCQEIMRARASAPVMKKNSASGPRSARRSRRVSTV